jgi:hypothetical protein
MCVRRLLVVLMVPALVAGSCGGGAGDEPIAMTVTTVSSAVPDSETTPPAGIHPTTITTEPPTTPGTVEAGTTAPSTTFPPAPPTTLPTGRTLPAQTGIWGWVEASYNGLLRIRRADGVAWEVVDPWYPSWFSVVAGHLSGGLVFQYSPLLEDGPPTVVPGTILQLAAGADLPVSLIEPEHGELYVLFEVSETEGAPTLIFASLTGWHASTHSFGPGTGPRSLWTLRIGDTVPRLVGTWGDQPGEPELLSASYADGRFLVAVRQRGSRCVVRVRRPRAAYKRDRAESASRPADMRRRSDRPRRLLFRAGRGDTTDAVGGRHDCRVSAVDPAVRHRRSRRG